MTASQADAAEITRLRLQADLRAAMKGRQALEVAVLRRLIAAIDNAGAVPITPGSNPPQHEVERRRLHHAEVQALLRKERERHEAAADELSRLGREAQAEEARLEAAIVSRYLASESGREWSGRGESNP